MIDSMLESGEAMLLGWHWAKQSVDRGGLISMDALHIVVGVILQLGFALILRKSLASWIPWILVFAALLLNEAVDLWVERWPDLVQQLGEGGRDIILTMALPTVLLLAVRRAPSLFAWRPHPRRR